MSLHRVIETNLVVDRGPVPFDEKELAFLCKRPFKDEIPLEAMCPYCDEYSIDKVDAQRVCGYKRYTT